MRYLLCIVCLLAAAGTIWAAEEEAPPLNQLTQPELKLPQRLEPFPHQLIVPNRPEINVATLDIMPGMVLKVGGGIETVAYRRPNQTGKLTSFDFGPWLWGPDPDRTVIYFSDATFDHRIYYALGMLHQAVLAVAPFIVKEVDIGPGNCLYVSEAYEGARDGRIWKLQPGHAPTVFYNVLRARVGGRWSGHFAFDPGGMLYISNGIAPGARVWRCPLGGVPVPVYGYGGPIYGFHFTDPQTFLFTNGTPQLRKHTLGGGTSLVLTSPGGHHYCDVRLR